MLKYLVSWFKYGNWLLLVVACGFVLLGNNDVYCQTKDSVEQKAIPLTREYWQEKQCKDKIGPGYHHFGLSRRNVRFKGEKKLVLRLVKHHHQWSCAEVYNPQSTGYGIYEFRIKTKHATFDPSVVLGLFLYNEAVPPYYNEIDVELSKWGVRDNDNTQYVVHNDSLRPLKHRFDTPGEMTRTIHRIIYLPDQICFESYYCPSNNFDKKIIYQQRKFKWRCETDDPKVLIRINLWLMEQVTNIVRHPKITIYHVGYQPLSD